MKVLNISTDDYANFAHDNANALRSVGVKCVDIKTSHHLLEYKTESKVVPFTDIVLHAKQADVIQIFHSDIRLLNYVKGLGKRIIVYHTGSRYRSDPKGYNDAFNPYVERSVIALCEFEGLGSKRETYICGSINHSQEVFRNTQSKIIIAHYPSCPKTKGTDIINMLLAKCTKKYIYRHSTDRVNHDTQMKRISSCDIYIELYKPEINGDEYGSWGITALEAASMGKVVVTQNLHNDYYEAIYGHCPLILVKDEKDFVKKVNWLLSLSHTRIDELKKETQLWFTKNHSYQATGERLKQIL